MNIYRLINVHLIEDYKNENYFLGYYSTIEKAQINISFYQSLPGFRENPNSFVIQKVFIEGGTINKNVYDVQFYLHDANFAIEYDYYIGVYSTKELAVIALNEFTITNQDLIISSELSKEDFINKIIVDEPIQSEGFTIYYNTN